MYECWVDKNEPKVRLMVAAGSSLPTELGHKDWQLLGPCDAPPEATAEIERRGYHFFESDEAHPDPQSLKNAAASGN